MSKDKIINLIQELRRRNEITNKDVQIFISNQCTPEFIVVDQDEILVDGNISTELKACYWYLATSPEQHRDVLHIIEERGETGRRYDAVSNKLKRLEKRGNNMHGHFRDIIFVKDKQEHVDYDKQLWYVPGEREIIAYDRKKGNSYSSLGEYNGDKYVKDFRKWVLIYSKKELESLSEESLKDSLLRYNIDIQDYYKNLKPVNKKGKLIENIKEMTSRIVEMIKEFAKKPFKVLDDVQSFFTNLLEEYGVLKLMRKVRQFVTLTVKDKRRLLKFLGISVGAITIAKFFEEIKLSINLIITVIKTYLPDSVVEKLQPFMDVVNSVIESVKTKLDWFLSSTKAAADKAADFIKSVMEKIFNLIRKGKEKIMEVVSLTLFNPKAPQT